MKMRKSWVGVVAAVCLATTAFGSTSFRWFGDNTVAKDRFGNDLPLGRTVVSFVSQDNVINIISKINAANKISQGDLASAYGDDVLVGAFASNDDVGLYGHYNYHNNATNDHVGYRPYAVVVDLPFASYSGFTNLPVGTWFGVSALGAALKEGPLNPPQSLEGGEVVLRYEVIPEPFAAALTLGGIAFLVIRRRFAEEDII